VGLPTSFEEREPSENPTAHSSSTRRAFSLLKEAVRTEVGEDGENEGGKPVESTTHSPCHPVESTASLTPGARSAAPSPLARELAERTERMERTRCHRCRWRRRCHEDEDEAGRVVEGEQPRSEEPITW
jgi:hypothetical protein